MQVVEQLTNRVINKIIKFSVRPSIQDTTEYSNTMILNG